MQTLIITTFLIILMFSVINMVINGIIWFSTKRQIYSRVAIFWLALIVNFFIQSKGQGEESLIILCYGFTIVPLSLLAYASLGFSRDRYPAKHLLPLIPLSVVLTIAVKDSAWPFWARAMPFALTAALPLLYVVYIYDLRKRHETTPLMKLHSVVIFGLALHSFNFAFFRMNPEAQLWGWPVAYALYQLLAALVPALTLDFYHREEQVRLQQIIDEQTRDLKNSNENLAKTGKEKDYLFKTLTHDISTPLQILSYKVEAQKRDPIQNLEKFLGSVENVAKRISMLVTQVKLFHSLQFEKFSLKLDSANLLDCVQQVETLFEDMLQRKGIKIEYDAEELRRIFVVVHVESFTSSVLANIISNAIKFSYVNGKISISARSTDSNSVCISIEDRGMGMPASILEQIYDFDSQTSRPGTQNEKGTGFGVPIVQKILSTYGGKVAVISREADAQKQNGFTRFEINLPRGKDLSSAA
ncbi:MAG: HAMP domain-containing histidine kinase [Bdellovibrionales bacterium]|nr:HAMP domain-containing histidine kinase [Bdellovibrionales bacterium]